MPGADFRKDHVGEPADRIHVSPVIHHAGEDQHRPAGRVGVRIGPLPVEIVQVHAVAERMDMLRRHARTPAEQIGLSLTDEQAGGGPRRDARFRLCQQPAFPPVDPAHGLARRIGVLPPLVAVQIDEIDDSPSPEPLDTFSERRHGA